MHSDCVLQNFLSLGAASFELARVGKSKSTTVYNTLGSSRRVRLRMAQFGAGFAEVWVILWLWLSVQGSCPFMIAR